ncbi:pro-neuregulin-2, membrane-bound isoform-like isoform X3 [Lutra lutra]|uniref:pro-neuregulin-2, membrane-bound isoform-like isoform X3 n=1 Tax=Lutra lutra TaxID=9657 RepID=UPI001FD25D97|nr:pro-neuregulin-2, membrane-bound isoform-like isoform X3 [Lutra lutra]
MPAAWWGQGTPLPLSLCGGPRPQPLPHPGGPKVTAAGGIADAQKTCPQPAPAHKQAPPRDPHPTAVAGGPSPGAHRSPARAAQPRPARASPFCAPPPPPARPRERGPAAEGWGRGRRPGGRASLPRAEVSARGTGGAGAGGFISPGGGPPIDGARAVHCALRMCPIDPQRGCLQGPGILASQPPGCPQAHLDSESECGITRTTRQRRGKSPNQYVVLETKSYCLLPGAGTHALESPRPRECRRKLWLPLASRLRRTGATTPWIGVRYLRPCLGRQTEARESPTSLEDVSSQDVGTPVQGQRQETLGSPRELKVTSSCPSRKAGT